MRIYRVVVPNDKLLGMPETERVLLVQLGHLCNELSFLNKLLLFSSDPKARGVERYAMVTQSMITARVFIGKIFEAWRIEPPRLLWRLHHLREWSHEEVDEVFAGVA